MAPDRRGRPTCMARPRVSRRERHRQNRESRQLRGRTTRPENDCRKGGLNAMFGEHAPDCHAGCQESQAECSRQPELLLRPFKDEFREWEAQGLVGSSKGLGGDGKLLASSRPMPTGLRTLPRKEKGILVDISERIVSRRGGAIPIESLSLGMARTIHKAKKRVSQRPELRFGPLRPRIGSRSHRDEGDDHEEQIRGTWRRSSSLSWHWHPRLPAEEQQCRRPIRLRLSIYVSQVLEGLLVGARQVEIPDPHYGIVAATSISPTAEVCRHDGSHPGLPRRPGASRVFTALAQDGITASVALPASVGVGRAVQHGAEDGSAAALPGHRHHNGGEVSYRFRRADSPSNAKIVGLLPLPPRRRPTSRNSNDNWFSKPRVYRNSSGCRIRLSTAAGCGFNTSATELQSKR